MKILIPLASALLVGVEVGGIFLIRRTDSPLVLGLFCGGILLATLLYEGVTNLFLVGGTLLQRGQGLLQRLSLGKNKKPLSYGAFQRYVQSYPQILMFKQKGLWDIALLGTLCTVILGASPSSLRWALIGAFFFHLLLFLALQRLRSLEEDFFTRENQHSIRFAGIFTTFFQNINALKGLNCEQRALEVFSKTSRSLAKASLLYNLVFSWQKILLEYSVFLPTVAVMLWMEYNAPGSRREALFLSFLFFGNTSEIFAQFVELRHIRHHEKKLQEELEDFGEGEDTPGGIKNYLKEGRISYAGGGELWIPSFSFERGQRVLILGETGKGKSLFIQSLLGLYPYDSLQSFQREAPRLGYIPQNRFIFKGTLGENIGLGDPVKIPVDWERLGGEKEMDSWLSNISGGQKTLVEIYRALNHDPDVLLVDELEKNIDQEGHDFLFHHPRLQNKTVITISHREDLWDYYDKVYKIEEAQLRKVKG